jgi:arginine exporter protein ArgO
VTAALVAGLLAGYGVAVPLGAVGAYLMTLTARTSPRIGAAAALGVASADGCYALLAVFGGSSLATALARIAAPLQVGAAVVLLLIAARICWPALRRDPEQRGDIDATVVGVARPEGGTRTGPRPALVYARLLGITLLNPTTVVYFLALVLGTHAADRRVAAALLFAGAAFLASASWQLVLVAGGALAGRLLSGPRGRRITALAASLLIVALAVRALLAA